MGPAIGRRGPVVGYTLATQVRPIALAARRPDLQAIINRSTRISSPVGISVGDRRQHDRPDRVGGKRDDRRIAENILRISGVANLRNELTVGPGGGAIPGPAPMAAPAGEHRAGAEQPRPLAQHRGRARSHRRRGRKKNRVARSPPVATGGLFNF